MTSTVFQNNSKQEALMDLKGNLLAACIAAAALGAAGATYAGTSTAGSGCGGATRVWSEDNRNGGWG